MKVLLIEDNRTDGVIVRSLLTRQEIDIEWVTNGADALQAVQSEEPDAVLCDLHLSGVDSADDILTNLRSSNPSVALIAYSGAPPRESLEQIDAFLPKEGLDGTTLSFVIRKAVQMRGEITRLKSL